MTLQQFIANNRADLDTCILRALNRGREKYPIERDRLNDSERRQWVLNDEGLYNWARSEGVRI